MSSSFNLSSAGETTALSDTGPLPAPVQIAAGQVAFALTPRSREYYFPLFKSARFGEITPEWIDLPGSSAATSWENVLRELNPSVIVTGWGTPPIPEWFAEPEGSAPRYICHLAGSVRPIVPRVLIEKGVVVSNWGTMVTHTVAEHAMLLLLGSLRNVGGWNSYLKGWSHNVTPFACDTLQTRTLRGCRVGLHGFGAIAREITQMLKPFQADVYSYSHGVPRRLFQEYGVRSCESLRELFTSCNVIIECESLTPQSSGSVTEELMELLPDDSIFINIGRAQTVKNEAALLRRAAAGKIRLGLDVFHREPLPPDSPFYDVPYAMMSPHIAGPTQDVLPKIAEFALRNVRQFLNGGNVEGRVTPDIYDRST